VLDGNVVYDRSQDVRAKHLLEGVQPPGTDSSVETSAQVEEHDDHGQEDEEGPKEGKDKGGKDNEDKDDEEDPERGL
jgi:hypothetical protein